jgi:hypothetical protein
MTPLDLEAAGSFFVTPSDKKRKARGQSRVASKALRESSTDEDEDDNYSYIRRRRKKSKSKSRPVVVTQQAMVVTHESCDNQPVDVLEVDTDEDLPKTGHFGSTLVDTEEELEEEELTVTSGGSASDTLPEKQLRSSQEYKESQQSRNLLESSTDSDSDTRI